MLGRSRRREPTGGAQDHLVRLTGERHSCAKQRRRRVRSACGIEPARSGPRRRLPSVRIPGRNRPVSLHRGGTGAAQERTPLVVRRDHVRNRSPDTTVGIWACATRIDAARRRELACRSRSGGCSAKRDVAVWLPTPVRSTPGMVHDGVAKSAMVSALGASPMGMMHDDTRLTAVAASPAVIPMGYRSGWSRRGR